MLRFMKLVVDVCFGVEPAFQVPSLVDAIAMARLDRDLRATTLTGLRFSIRFGKANRSPHSITTQPLDVLTFTSRSLQAMLFLKVLAIKHCPYPPHLLLRTLAYFPLC